MRRSLFTPVVLSLGVAILAGVVWLSGNQPRWEDHSTAVRGLQGDRLEETKRYEYSPGNAQTKIMASTTSSTSTSSTTTATATAALVSIKGIVSGSPESVSFSGQAQINSKMVTDPDFGSPPKVVLSIDLSNISGVGLSTKTKYVTPSQEILIRPLVVSDQVQITFPFFPSGTTGVSSTRMGVASIDLSFDVSTGTLTEASGYLTSP